MFNVIKLSWSCVIGFALMILSGGDASNNITFSMYFIGFLIYCLSVLEFCKRIIANDKGAQIILRNLKLAVIISFSLTSVAVKVASLQQAGIDIVDGVKIIPVIIFLWSIGFVSSLIVGGVDNKLSWLTMCVKINLFPLFVHDIISYKKNP